jgi:hypothetical protein
MDQLFLRPVVIVDCRHVFRPARGSVAPAAAFVTARSNFYIAPLP